MKRTVKLIDSNTTTVGDLSPYQEIAIYVRELLESDYALVAVPEGDSIRIPAIAGPDRRTSGHVAADLISKLRDWGPLVADESRLIAVPVSDDDQVVAVLVGYCSDAGAFTASDLEGLVAYSNVAAAILANLGSEETGETKTTFSNEQLRQFSRLITLGQLATCFAQDLMNPLTLIRGHLQFIQETLPGDESVRTNFEVIDRASRRIEEVAKRMQDFGKKRIRRLDCWDVTELITDALRFIQPYIRHPFIDVQQQFDSELRQVKVDRSQVVHAIVNVLQNSVDAMAGSDRRILSISARAMGEQVQIAICDTGPGIPSCNIPEIFEPFFTTKEDRATGLGLYVTKQVIEEHHGTIALETSDRGTNFVINLPISLPS